MLVVALAFSDLLMINSQAPPLFINVFMSRWWAFGEKLCDLYALAGGILGMDLSRKSFLYIKVALYKIYF